MLSSRTSAGGPPAAAFTPSRVAQRALWVRSLARRAGLCCPAAKRCVRRAAPSQHSPRHCMPSRSAPHADVACPGPLVGTTEPTPVVNTVCVRGIPTDQTRPRALRPWRNGAPMTIAGIRQDAAKADAGGPHAVDLSEARSAGLVCATHAVSGTRRQRSAPDHLSTSLGRNSRSPIGTGTSPRARVSDTSAWQFACLPRARHSLAAGQAKMRGFVRR